MFINGLVLDGSMSNNIRRVYVPFKYLCSVNGNAIIKVNEIIFWSHKLLRSVNGF